MKGNMRKFVAKCVIVSFFGCLGLLLLGIYSDDNSAFSQIEVPSPRAYLPSLSHCYMYSTPSGNEWETFKSMVDTLNSIDADYTVAVGTVLSWYRDCSFVGNDDLDFMIEFTWFMTNLEKLEAALVSAGWTKIKTFGKLGIIGYEQAWKKKESLKADLFSVAQVNGKYVNGLTIGKRTYPCYSIQSSISLQTWNGLTFPVPVPTEAYLVGKYGTTWREKHVKGYKWDVEPFKTENGRQHCVDAPMPEFPEHSGI